MSSKKDVGKTKHFGIFSTNQLIGHLDSGKLRFGRHFNNRNRRADTIISS